MALFPLAQSELSEAKRLQNEGDYPRAIALLENYLWEKPDDAEGGTLLAWLYVQTGQQERAVETYRSLLSRHPDEADLHNSLGALPFKKRELEEAKHELETAVTLDRRGRVPARPRCGFNGYSCPA